MSLQPVNPRYKPYKGPAAGWGGLNAVVAHLVLAGAIAPGADYDHAGMIGHAWIWDPLFALWGLALAVALVVGRPRHQ